MRTLHHKVLALGLLILLVKTPSLDTAARALTSVSPATTAATSPGSATGTAIGNGVKSFLDAVFPSGSALLGQIQSWLTKKLNLQQQKEVITGADTKKTSAPSDPTTKPAVLEIQNAAQTLELTSVVLYQTNQASGNVLSMLAILKITAASSPLPLPRLKQQWEDVKGELSALNENGVLTKAQAATTDIAVLGAFQDLESATKGPVGTVNDNIVAQGDRAILGDALQKILDATTKFNNLAVVLLGSTGTEITKQLNNFSKAGGASQLDDLAEKAVVQARATIPDPTK